MRLKKRFRTMLGAIMAAVMVVTAVPISDITVQAAEITTAEDVTEESAEETTESRQEEKEQDSEVLTEEQRQNDEEASETQTAKETTEESETEDQSADDESSQLASETETQSETQTEEETQSETQTEEETEAEESKVVQAEENTYAGPTIDASGNVTFYYNNTENESDVSVKGSWDWGNPIPMKKQEDTSTWQITVPVETIGWKTVEYGFQLADYPETDQSDGWRKDTENPNGSGNSKINRNPEINADGDVILYYYPEHGTYPSAVNVKYRAADDSSAAETTKAMTRKSGSTYYSITLDKLEEGDYQYYFEVDSNTVQDTNNSEGTGKFTVEPGEYAGPTINYTTGTENGNDPGAVTFYYDGSASEAVVVKGSWSDGWAEKTKLEKDTDTGLYSVEIPTSKIEKTGTYEYGFETGASQNESGQWNGTWSVDTANPSTKGNSKIYRNPQVGVNNEVMLYYYPSHGTYPVKVSVKYRAAVESGENNNSYATIQMSRDSIDTAVYSAKMSKLEVGDYEYYFEVVSKEGEQEKTTEIQDTNNAAGTGKFTVEPGEYKGPTINYTTGTEDGNDPGAVTFYFDGSAPEAVVVKGSWDAGWVDLIQLEKSESTGLYSVELPTSKLKKKGIYEYGFETGAAQNEDGIWKGTWSVDTANPNAKGNSKIYRNPQIVSENNVNNVKLYYYPSHGTYPDEVVVQYKKKADSSYTELSMALDGENSAVYSATINSVELETVYEYYFEVTTGEGSDAKTTRIDDTNNDTVGEFMLAEYPDEPEGLTSPVVEGRSVTFNYYNPQAESVSVAGDWTSWEKNPVAMVYDEATGVWSVTCTISKGIHEYKFIVGTSWITDPKNNKKTESVDPNSIVEVTAGGVSEYPAVKGNKVTFSYSNDKLAADEQVSVVGSMNSWTKHAPEYMMKKNAETGEWELTVTLAPGVYAYKFFYGSKDSEAGWASDLRNTNPLTEDNGKNNQFFIAGLEEGRADIARGADAELPSKLKLYDIEGSSVETAVTYALSEETAAAAYKDKITLAGTKVSITEDFPESVKSFTLTASDAENNTAVMTVSVVDAVYTYTIYYYDRDESHRSVDASALWIWNEVKSGEISVDGGSEHNFDEAVELSDGNTWLKATVRLSYTGLGLKAKNKGVGVWTWEELNRKYTNADMAEEVTLYMVSDDGTKIYTELPEVKPILPRYLVAEYTRETQKDADWYFYTWNSGFGSDVFVKFEEKNGTATALIPVKQGLSSISFCLERTDETTGEHWGEKDGTDYVCELPVDQNVVKIKMEEGKGITYVYPYNIGYEIEPAKDSIHFYYRDDDAFLAGDKGFVSASVEIAVKDEEGSFQKEEYAMTYSAAEQRFVYDMPDLSVGTYYYRYLLKETEDAEGKYVLDRFNENKEKVDGVEYSVCTYELYDVALDAAMQNDSMDYNDNNVLTLTLSAKDSNDETADASGIVSRATVDLSAIGGGIAEIDPALMQYAIAVKDTTPAGTKTFPITVYDKYNNEYTTEVSVNVISRTNSSYIADDFDWDEAVIYFTVTDRFFDGNASNNNGDAAGSYDKNAETGCSSYHGGDFAGLTQKLDYLQDLGVNTIWITPIVENQLTPNSVDNPAVTKAWGYHGYWAKNFENLDAHLGTEAEFKALLDAAHAKGIKIMVDVVLNHSGYGDDVTNYFNNYPTEDGALRMLRNDDEIVSGSDQQSSLSGLPDFLTENPEVRELLVEWQSNWISKYDIDYYRVDTVKHVDGTTWSAFKNALTQINPDFKMIGEYAGGGYATDTGMLRSGRMDSLLDFDYNDRALDFVTGKISETEKFLTARNAAIDNTSTLGAFLSSHDEDGFVFKLTDTSTDEYHYGKTQEEASALAKVAASLQLTSKGQAVIYYGEEIGLTGAENYPYNTNRYDFDWSQTEAGANNTTLKHYKKLLDIRNRYSKVLAKGSRKTIDANDSKGLDVFSRSYAGTTLTVALNITNAPVEYTLSDQKENAYLYDYYNGMQYQANASGEVTIKIPAAAEGGTVVLVEKKVGNVGEAVDTDAVENMFDVEPIADQIYTGKNIVLSEEQLKVYDGSRRMKLGTDYTVSYKNNKNAGTAVVTVKGKGNYTGKVTKEFEILPKQLDDKDVAIQYQADLLLSKKVQKPITKITYNGMKLGTKDYQITYYSLDAATGERKEALTTAGVKETGVYEMVIAGGKSGNYAGEAVKRVEVHESGTLMSKTTVAISLKKAEYTGYPIKPSVTVDEKVKGKKVSVSSANYTVGYTNNVNVGTATVTVSGKPSKGYYGSVSKTFKITGKTLSSVAKPDTAKWQASVPYDFSAGRSVQPSEALALIQKNSSSPAVVLGKDYTVAYSKNTAPGTATVTFTGKGMYTGALKKTFKITPISLAEISKEKLVCTVQETAPYAKKGAAAGVEIRYENVVLRQGVDYKLTYGNNKAVTTSSTAKKPFVKITGIGKFTGVLPNQEFSIVKADLASSDLSVPDVVYQDKAGKFISTPVLDNAKIKAADYTTEYYLVNYDDAGNETGTESKDNTFTAAAGSTIRVKVTAVEGNANYTGEITRDYRVVTKNIASASVKIQAKVYTGYEVKLTEEDFSKIKVGKEELTLGKDYVIVESSYTNNIRKGTASVTIKGIGNYGGTKKVTFKITSRQLASLENMFS